MNVNTTGRFGPCPDCGERTFNLSRGLCARLGCREVQRAR